jgi:hypothetical protein
MTAAGECRVVISQPMLFPWVGMFEQIRLADVYVHYTDVQFSKGSFVNRVQIKMADGFHWLTVPLKNLSLGQNIDEVEINETKDWRRGHLDFLAQALRGAPHVGDALALVESVYAEKSSRLADVAIRSLEAVLAYFGLAQGRRFVRSPDLGIGGAGSARVLEIVKKLGGTVYVTGHGARNYLEHEAFERAGVRVEYMDYRRTPYPQLHGAFNPHVSILDLIANTGRAGLEFIHSQTVNWKEFA